MGARFDAARMFEAQQHLTTWRLLTEKWLEGAGLKKGSPLRIKQQHRDIDEVRHAEPTISVITTME